MFFLLTDNSQTEIFGGAAIKIGFVWVVLRGYICEEFNQNPQKKPTMPYWQADKSFDPSPYISLYYHYVKYKNEFNLKN